MITEAQGLDLVDSSRPRVLVLGGTGRTGGLVVRQLLDRGVAVRALARSAERLPAECTSDPRLEIVAADLLSLRDGELVRHVQGCDAVVSCLGHTNDLRGVFGPPYDLVTSATRRVYAAALALRPRRPLRFVLMSSVSVTRFDGLDTRRRPLERAAMGLLRTLLPPSGDNQHAADFLCREVGRADPFLEWVVVRPDTLLAADPSAAAPDYRLHTALISSICKPDHTSRAGVARFMCELVCDAQVWEEWRGELPVIVDVPATGLADRSSAASRRAA